MTLLAAPKIVVSTAATGGAGSVGRCGSHSSATTCCRPLRRFIGASGSPVGVRQPPALAVVVHDDQRPVGGDRRGMLDDRRAVWRLPRRGRNGGADAGCVREILDLPVAARPPPEAKQRIVGAARDENLGVLAGFRELIHPARLLRSALPVIAVTSMLRQFVAASTSRRTIRCGCREPRRARRRR